MTGSDDRSKRRFIVLEDFMMCEMGLSGIPLLVYARIFGFNAAGYEFFESKRKTAELINTTQRTVFRAIEQLVDEGLIAEVGEAARTETRTYRICEDALPDKGRALLSGRASNAYDNLSYDEIPYDKRAREGPLAYDNLSPPLMTFCHPIRKIDNKGF